ncbi:hypothetical protein [Saccharopolyspora griseoalba]|uniref:Aminoglycoside phosphotransferase n=1 Tax=Saccharopolyspora griseoalba TaxID=1431848 RepID=A0ABW2LV37_9PSEU
MDLRTQPVTTLLDSAERALGVTLESEEQAARKRRTVGVPTRRGTWVRISATPAESAAERSGLEATVALPPETLHPRWYQGVCWCDGATLWRAEETELVPEPVVQQGGGVLTTDPQLPEVWWQRLAGAQRALSTVATSRLATPHTRPISQQRVTETIQAVFPGLDTTVGEWAVAHADFAWVNLTAPACRILDWEDFGLAPRGWDAATLWVNSLAVPALAERVQQVFADELHSPTGVVCQLYALAELIAAGEDYAGPLAAPVHAAAEALVTTLSRRGSLAAAGSR